MRCLARRALVCACLVLPVLSHGQRILGEEPALGSPESRITQQEIASGELSLDDLRLAGLKVFVTAFRKSDGHGDGPVNPADPTAPGGRPMLQDNGAFLRVNGLDAQSCLDCHSIVSAATMPATLGVGGAGGLNNSAMFMTQDIDVADRAGQGFASFDGRLINPPALFGAGGVQLVAEEMTRRLQKLRRKALRHPGQRIRLRAKGVEFGSIVADAAGRLDTSAVEGIDADLVVRPFGRKGEFATVRGFDVGALMFHLGMRPVEVAGEGVDDDGDGVVNEVLIGEVSALSVFVATQDTPVQARRNQRARRGFRQFRTLGCAECHRPVMYTRGTQLNFRYPEIDTDPSANVFYSVDLRRPPMRFRPGRRGRGIAVPMFSDLKRHDMGDGLAEDFHGASAARNREFITAKLWGVADTAPYLHDGRAFTLNAAITLHGGEARAARDAYLALDTRHKNELIAFLMTLRNPDSPNEDVAD